MNNGKISLLHPSRGRPQKAKETSKYWFEKSSGRIRIEHILSLDSDDEKLPEYLPGFPIIVNHNKSVVDATNKAAEYCSKSDPLLYVNDILIYLSDDFKCPQDWDLLIFEKFENITTPKLLKVNDGLQNFDVPVLTIPIMNRQLYERLGYFWQPDYKSMFVDQQLFEVCKKHDFIMYAPELVFKHEHFINGYAENDETYQRSNANWNQGKELFEKHKEQGFPI